MAQARWEEIVLDTPRLGEQQVAHDTAFEAWDGAFSIARDVVNLGIDALNKAGAGLSRLPEGDLEELLIRPLAGDYRAIRQNANACHDVREALSVWSGNLGRLSCRVAAGWDGLAAAACVTRLNAGAAGAAGVGALVARGARLLDAIADVGERCGVIIEGLVVQLGKTIARLAGRLLAKVAGPAGWLVFAAELLVTGLDAVTDIIDDVRMVLEIIGSLRELRHTIADWAAEQGGRLGLFAELAAEFGGPRDE